MRFFPSFPSTVQVGRENTERSTVMLNLFAAFFFGYFYFYGFWTDKVKVLFAANNGVTTFA